MKNKVLTLLLIGIAIGSVGCSKNKEADTPTTIEKEMSETEQEDSAEKLTSESPLEQNESVQEEVENEVSEELKNDLDALENSLNETLQFMRDYKQSNWSTEFEADYDNTLISMDNAIKSFSAKYNERKSLNDAELAYYNESIGNVKLIINTIKNIKEEVEVAKEKKAMAVDEDALKKLKSAIADLTIDENCKETMLDYMFYDNVAGYRDNPNWRFRTADWTMCGVTITFQPEELPNGTIGYNIKNGVVNKFIRAESGNYGNKDMVSAASCRDNVYIKPFREMPNYAENGTLGTMQLDGYNFLYTQLMEAHPEYIELTSNTYRDAEYTIFIERHSVFVETGLGGHNDDQLMFNGDWNVRVDD